MKEKFPTRALGNFRGANGPLNTVRLLGDKEKSCQQISISQKYVPRESESFL